jgi:hypothetical protein
MPLNLMPKSWTIYTRKPTARPVERHQAPTERRREALNSTMAPHDVGPDPQCWKRGSGPFGYWRAAAGMRSAQGPERRVRFAGEVAGRPGAGGPDGRGVAPAVAEHREASGDGCVDQESGEQESGKYHVKCTSGE